MKKNKQSKNKSLIICAIIILGSVITFKNKSKNEKLSFVYDVKEGLGERISSYKSIDTLHDVNYVNLSSLLGFGDLWKKNIYTAKRNEILEVEFNNKKCKIIKEETFTYEENTGDLTNIFDNNLSSGGGVKVKGEVYGSLVTVYKVAYKNKIKIYYSIEPIANRYFVFPSNSNKEYLRAYNSEGGICELKNLGGGKRNLLIDF